MLACHLPGRTGNGSLTPVRLLTILAGPNVGLLALTHLIAVSLVRLAHGRESGRGLGGPTGSRTSLNRCGERASTGDEGAVEELPGNRRVTLETFKKIRPKMENGDVQELFGDAGNRVGWTAIGNVLETEVVEWTGPQDMAADQAGPPPKITVYFEKSKVADRRATNLK